MPLLSTQANLLTNPSLQKGMIEVIIKRGARALLEKLPFKSFKGSSHDFVHELALPDGDAHQDPYGSNNIPEGVGTVKRIAVNSKMLVWNADTAVIDTIGKSDINDLRATDLLKAAKKLASQFTFYHVNGIPDADTDRIINGWEYWLAYYLSEGFTEQVVYGTDTGLVGGTGQNLSLKMIDDLLSRNFGQEFDAIYSDRVTAVAAMNLYNLQGGNTVMHFTGSGFGGGMESAMYFVYKGKPWYILDDAGAAKTSNGNGAITMSDATLTVDRTPSTGDPNRFPGFSSLDVGRAVAVPGAATGPVTLNTTIASVTDAGEAELAATADITVTDASITVAATNVIYAVRYDEVDGMVHVYHENLGVPANVGEYYGPIAGFDAEDMGKLESSERFRTRLTHYGNTAAQDPYCIARLSHYVVS